MPGMRTDKKKNDFLRKTPSTERRNFHGRPNGDLRYNGERESRSVLQGTRAPGRNLTGPKQRLSQPVCNSSAKVTQASTPTPKRLTKELEKSRETAVKHSAAMRRRNTQSGASITSTGAPDRFADKVTLNTDLKLHRGTAFNKEAPAPPKKSGDSSLATALQSCGVIRPTSSGAALRYDAPAFVPEGGGGEGEQKLYVTEERERSTAQQQNKTGDINNEQEEREPLKNHLTNGGSESEALPITPGILEEGDDGGKNKETDIQLGSPPEGNLHTDLLNQIRESIKNLNFDSIFYNTKDCSSQECEEKPVNPNSDYPESLTQNKINQSIGSLSSVDQLESFYSDDFKVETDYKDDSSEDRDSSEASSTSPSLPGTSSFFDSDLEDDCSGSEKSSFQKDIIGKSPIDNILATDDYPSERFIVNLCKALLITMDTNESGKKNKFGKEPTDLASLNGAKASENFIKKLFKQTFTQINTTPSSKADTASDSPSYVYKKLESSHGCQERLCSTEMGEISMLSDTMEKLKNDIAAFRNNLANLENFKRKNNVKIRGISESIQPSQLKDYVSSMVSHFFPDIQGKNLVEKAFRIRRPPSLPSNIDTDVIVSFYPGWIRNSLLGITKEPRFLSSTYSHLTFFKDLCKETLKKRKMFQYTTCRLQQAGIPYNWYQFSDLRVKFASKWYTFSSPTRSADFLRNAGIISPKAPPGLIQND